MTDSPRNSRRRSPARAVHASQCPLCTGAIAVGDAIRRDATNQQLHHDCARRRPTVHAPAPPVDGPASRASGLELFTCPGCGTPVRPDELPESVPVFGTRWHGDCKRWSR